MALPAGCERPPRARRALERALDGCAARRIAGPRRLVPGGPEHELLAGRAVAGAAPVPAPLQADRPSRASVRGVPASGRLARRSRRGADGLGEGRGACLEGGFSTFATTIRRF